MSTQKYFFLLKSPVPSPSIVRFGLSKLWGLLQRAAKSDSTCVYALISAAFIFGVVIWAHLLSGEDLCCIDSHWKEASKMSLEGLSGPIRSVHSAALRLCNGESLLYMSRDWKIIGGGVGGIIWVDCTRFSWISTGWRVEAHLWFNCGQAAVI